jgi:lysylphosphatidylglycerol synthetase-like protein (DUF2156 family)
MGHPIDDTLGLAPDTVLRQHLTVLQSAHPIFLLFFFLTALIIHSIVAPEPTASPTTMGLGNRPLPAIYPTRNLVKRAVYDDVTQTQRCVFKRLSVAAALTFVGNSVLTIARSLVMKKEHWWAGRSAVVRVPDSGAH